MVPWVYVFVGCPWTGDAQQITNEGEPDDVLVRQRPAAQGTVDTFVREGVDRIMLVARYRWVADGAPVMSSEPSGPPAPSDGGAASEHRPKSGGRGRERDSA